MSSSISRRLPGAPMFLFEDAGPCPCVPSQASIFLTKKSSPTKLFRNAAKIGHGKQDAKERKS